MNIKMDTDGIKIIEVGTVTGESASTSYELTLVLPGKVSQLKFGEKPKEELVKQLIELTGAYKATLQEVKTTTTEYKGKTDILFHVKNPEVWKTGWMLENAETIKGGFINGN
ncbi:hypothetical protein BigBertha_170 [Bacillus phage BigBertha]|uniref:Uncharacterized protein n=3 Tax=Bequatrovirus TaxID=1917990 RepID=U5PW52_9CAUD|nr:hypothetical protein TROLL_178 [Bacillus phage Troll]YP_008771197.1 hypothetical protein BigBertha_170 [Bacillus phage BigBertha]AGT13531.1 hypothetical protein TROLL_178 [Bacillus phage Troll]AGY46678.1 hypothetical protein BigBertha_170 [Bacillus phage BigBertha]AMW61699.1 hypothetical protein JUGLONE_174 [Bacillus phage Juglone]